MKTDNINATTSLGDCIRQERKKYKLTQAQLGEKIGLKSSRVSKIENGAPISLETATFILGKMGSELELKVTNSQTERLSLPFVMSAIYYFSKIKNISLARSYRYLKTFKGLEYLNRYWEIDQTLPMEVVTKNLTKICANNGGAL